MLFFTFHKERKAEQFHNDVTPIRLNGLVSHRHAPTRRGAAHDDEGDTDRRTGGQTSRRTDGRMEKLLAFSSLAAKFHPLATGDSPRPSSSPSHVCSPTADEIHVCLLD